MFWAVLHKSTNSWFPYMKTKIERDAYARTIGKLDATLAAETSSKKKKMGKWEMLAANLGAYGPGVGEADTAPAVLQLEALTFEKGFKYSNIELAIGTVRSYCQQYKEYGILFDHFEVKEFERWPIEFLSLHRPGAITKSVTMKTVSENWQGFSKTYCTHCGTLIPFGVKYLSVTPGTAVCGFCLHEIAEKAAATLKDLPEDFVKSLEAGRFVGMV